MLNVATTATIPMDAEFLSALTYVGQIVHVDDATYHVHSVEGRTWYVFNQDGQITFDTGLTASPWHIGEGQATLIPMGHKVGQGFGHVVPLSWVKRGPSLVKLSR